MFYRSAPCLGVKVCTHNDCEYTAPIREKRPCPSHPGSNLIRPYLVSAGIDNGVNYIFVMTPLMAEIAATADFIQTDITYDHMQCYKYLFHAVAFNHVTMDWMVIAHIWMDKQNSDAYALGFRKNANLLIIILR